MTTDTFVELGNNFAAKTDRGVVVAGLGTVDIVSISYKGTIIGYVSADEDSAGDLFTRAEMSDVTGSAEVEGFLSAGDWKK